MIADTTIDAIRSRANLADVIGESVKLERKGRNLVGLCPFHKEKSPSFNVNEDRGFYHCFGCKASGDVFSFVQQTEGLSFYEAVRRLAEKCGIEIEDDLSSEDRKRREAEKRKEKSYYEVSATAAGYFEKMLTRHPHADFARQELLARGLPLDGPAQPVLAAFRVGYAPDGWDGLSEHLKQAGHDLRAAEAVGLLAPRKSGGGFYDRFRHRLMFAVIDLQGRVVAFSGRALAPVDASEEVSNAKYINSPESPIYRKRATVFGLHQARSTLRSGQPCVLVEGNFDVVSLHAHGLSCAVAPLGTAFTPEQGALIRRFSQQITLLFDGDSAGKKATLDSRAVVKQCGLAARVARLPGGTDPDDFVRERGSKALSELLSSASGMLEYLLEQTLDEQFTLADSAGRAEKIQQVVELLRSEDDPNVRVLAEQHADRLAGRLGIADGRTFRALRSNIARSLRAKEPEEREATPKNGRSSRSPSLETMILGAWLDFPELCFCDEVKATSTYIEGDLALSLSCLLKAQEEHLAQVARSSGHHFSDGSAWLHRLASRLPESLQDFAAARLAAPLHTEIDSARVELFANLDKLKKMDLKRLSSSALSDMERARQEGDFEQEIELLRQQEQRARGKRGL